MATKCTNIFQNPAIKNNAEKGRYSDPMIPGMGSPYNKKGCKTSYKQTKDGKEREIPQWRKEHNEKFQAKKDAIAAEKARLLKITQQRREETYGVDQSNFGQPNSSNESHCN